MQFEYLADHPELVPQVIDWWHSTWADRMGSDFPALRQQLLAALSRDQLPLHILAMDGKKAIGTAALKLQELAELYPERQFWLGSVYVDRAHRGEKTASALSMKIVELAQARGIPHLYLQTIALDGGLYGRLGRKPVEQFSFRGTPTLLMCKTF